MLSAFHEYIMFMKRLMNLILCDTLLFALTLIQENTMFGISIRKSPASELKGLISLADGCDRLITTDVEDISLVSYALRMMRSSAHTEYGIIERESAFGRFGYLIEPILNNSCVTPDDFVRSINYPNSLLRNLILTRVADRYSEELNRDDALVVGLMIILLSGATVNEKVRYGTILGTDLTNLNCHSRRSNNYSRILNRISAVVNIIQNDRVVDNNLSANSTFTFIGLCLVAAVLQDDNELNDSMSRALFNDDESLIGRLVESLSHISRSKANA